MKKLVNNLIGSCLIFFAYAGTALGVQVTIDPAAYTGKWSMDYGSERLGAAVVDLGPVDPAIDAHVISVGGAELFFNVAANGKVTVANGVAAAGGTGTLRFNTTTVTVDPVFFSGNWRIIAGATPDLTGVQTVTLVPGLSFYGLEVGATGAFTFHVAGDGTVTVQNSLAATGAAGALTLNNTERFLK